MAFRINQRTRFHPETLLWIVLHHFARSARITAKEMINGIHGVECEWGRRGFAEDPVFDRLYGIITGYEHITHHFTRSYMSSSSAIETEWGHREYLDYRLRRQWVCLWRICFSSFSNAECPKTLYKHLFIKMDSSRSPDSNALNVPRSSYYIVIKLSDSTAISHRENIRECESETMLNSVWFIAGSDLEIMNKRLRFYPESLL